ncbi:MAG: peptide chain release factor N(5)-glutamine methyltransferase [Cyanobacteria bacterium P01_D01_bin.156]
MNSQSVSGETLYQWRLQAQVEAQTANIAVYEVDWLLQGISNLSQTDLSLSLYRDRTVPLNQSVDWLTHQWGKRLTKRVPVQYLMGETPWRDLMLTVTPDVLIPRPETELMVDIVQDWVSQQNLSPGKRVWADLGTGSGAIAIAVAKAFPQDQILAVDISSAALEVAQQNARRNQAHNVEFYQSNWLDSLATWQGRLSGIITNPPYIPSAVVLNLDPEVTEHEPHQALDGGSDGLNDIRSLIEQSHNFLRPDGLWLTEHMQGQSQIIAQLLTAHNAYQTVQVHHDLAGIKRFVSATANY